MNRCGTIRPWISRSVDGDLEPGEALRLARHLARCTACRITLARESRLAEMLGGVDDAFSVDESFFGAVMASLPERPVRPGVEVSRRARWRRGLRLAAFGSVGALGAGLAARVLPSLHLDVATPGMPRFTPDETDGWISLIGSAAQWIRVTAQSITWAGSSGAWNASTIGVLWLAAALAGVATLLALSGALAWATRSGSRAS
jgi:predicted anti-sigma-YlaC factor YlaD